MKQSENIQTLPSIHGGHAHATGAWQRTGAVAITESSSTLRQVVTLASQTLDAPMAFVSFSAGDREFIREQIGITGPLRPADALLPADMLEGDELLLLPDIRSDGRAIGAADLLDARFALAMPICDESGTRIGTLCLLDKRPRPPGLRLQERTILEGLAALAAVQRTLPVPPDAPAPAEAKPAISASEAELITVFSQAMVGILHRDISHRILMVNDYFCALVGRPAEMIDGLPMESFTHPDDVEENSRQHRAHQRTGTPFQIEKRYVRLDGSVVWCAVHISFVRDEKGKVCSTITVAQDITARKLAEQALCESEEHHRCSVALSPQIPWTAGPDGSIEEVGPLWLKLTGYSDEQARGQGWIAALHRGDVERTLADWQQAREARAPLDVEYRIRTGGAGYRWMRARAAPRFDADGAIVRWYGTLEDVHDRKLAKQALADSEERFRLAIQSARLGTWDYDAVTGRREWSQEFKAMLGLPPDAEPTIATALTLVHPEDRPQLESIIQAVAAGTAPHHFETALRIRHADNGAERWLKSTGWKTLSSSGCLSLLIVTFQDVTEEHDTEQRILWAATHDPLTRLPNRTALQSALEETARQSDAQQGGFGLLLLDLDDLKRSNDTLGHDAGDALLRTFTARLLTIVSSDATVGRLGGDEFAIILPDIADQQALQGCATMLLQELHKPFVHEGRVLDCAASIGASIFPVHGNSAPELLKSADLALYAAKANGRGRVMMFQAEMRSQMQCRTSMMSMAREAVDRDLIVPFYQPKIDLKSGTTVGFEALLRWCHPGRGFQAPDTIAAAFEDPNLAYAITDRMLEAITTDLQRWRDAGFDPGSIALNASAADFKFDDLAERVLERLSRCGLPTACLEIEVTETVFLGRGAEYVERALDLFSREGILVALDDFGTGYASLSHLKQYPVDILKIDRSFVSNLEQSPGDAAIVNAVADLGKNLGVTVVAEGIETQAQADHLLARGCTLGQGYFFGRPQPREDVTRWLARARCA